MQELLQAFKFQERKSLKNFFVNMLEEFITNYLSLPDFDALVSVPMDVRKEGQRGFNQALLLSRTLAKKLQIEDLSSFLKKKNSALTQSLLNRGQRAKNIEGSFVVKNPETLAGKKILLIDDILTTGFTASECAKTLKQSGAVSVSVLAVARGF